MKPLAQLVPDAAAFDREVVAGLQRAVGHTITTAVTMARNEHRWKDRTYATRSTIDGGVRDTGKGSSGFIKAGRIAAMLNEGTRPHRIMPKLGARFVGPAQAGQGRRARGRGRTFLKFEVGGRIVFARSVNHPGTRPDPFLEAAQDYAGAEIDRAVGAMLDGLL